MKIKKIVIGLLCMFVLVGEQPGVAKSKPQEPLALNLAESVNPFTENIAVRGSLGGIATAVAVSGNYLYMGSNYFLKVVNITDPTQPVEVAQLAMNGILQEIVIQGNLAYLALDYSGLVIIDISNPLAPVEVGRSLTFPPNILQDLDVEGGIAGILGWESHEPSGTWVVKFVDISNPANPVETSKLTALEYPQDIALEGNYAYVAVLDSGMQILDISDPAHPAEVGFYYTNNRLYGLSVEGQRAYLARESSLDIVDVSNPGNPHSLGIIALVPNEYTTVATQGNLAFVSRYDTLVVLEVSDPGAIDLIGSFATSFIRDFVVTETEVYIAGDSDGLRVVDISGLPSITEIGVIDDISSFLRLAASGNSAYLISPSDTLWALDITDRAHPSVVGKYFLPEDNAYPDPDLAIWGNYLYATTDSAGLIIFNASDPANLVEIGSYAPSNWYPRNITIIGSYAYISVSNGVQVLDISEPTNPVNTGIMLPEANKIIVQGLMAYFLGPGTGYYDAKLRVYDVSNPASPVELGSYTLPDESISLFDMVVADAQVFISYDDGIWVIDTSEPAHPVEISFYPFPNLPQLCGKKLSGFSDQLFISRNSCGLSVLNIADPYNIKYAGNYSPIDTNESRVGPATVIEPYLYVNSNLGITILEYIGYTAMGRVTQSNRLPFSNADISFDGQSTIATDATGVYTLTGFTLGTHTITPTLPGFDFWPGSHSISFPLSGTQTALYQNFTILPEPVSAIVSPGVTTTLMLTDTQNLTTTLIFSPASVSQPITITLTPTITSAGLGFTFSGHAFELSTAPIPDLVFDIPVLLTIRYSAEDVSMVSDKAELGLLWWDGNNWQEISETCIPPGDISHDIKNQMIEIPICHTGKYALFGPTNNVILPLIFHH